MPEIDSDWTGYTALIGDNSSQSTNDKDLCNETALLAEVLLYLQVGPNLLINQLSNKLHCSWFGPFSLSKRKMKH